MTVRALYWVAARRALRKGLPWYAVRLFIKGIRRAR